MRRRHAADVDDLLCRVVDDDWYVKILKFKLGAEGQRTRPEKNMKVTMPLVPHPDVIEERLATFPLATFKVGEVVFLAGSRSDHLLFLKKGAVAVVKDGIEVARVTQRNAVFGELSVLLDQPHTADVRAVEASQFHVAGANLLVQDPFVHLYVTAILARRLNAANRFLVELKMQLAADQRGPVVEKTIKKMEGLLGQNSITDLALLT